MINSGEIPVIVGKANPRTEAVLGAAFPGGEGRIALCAYAFAMPAYVIAETEIDDPEQYEKYKAASPGAIAAGGGRFLVRGGEVAVLEGDWEPSRLVILEFEDLGAAKRWYESHVYQEVKRLREGAARLRVVAVQGVQ